MGRVVVGVGINTGGPGVGRGTVSDTISIGLMSSSLLDGTCLNLERAAVVLPVLPGVGARRARDGNGVAVAGVDLAVTTAAHDLTVMVVVGGDELASSRGGVHSGDPAVGALGGAVGDVVTGVDPAVTTATHDLTVLGADVAEPPSVRCLFNSVGGEASVRGASCVEAPLR